MKKILSMFLLLFPLVAGAQKIEGRWTGIANLGVMSLRINFEIGKDGQGGWMQSPDQSPQWIEASSVAYSDGELIFTVGALGFEYRGVLGGDAAIRGSFTQNGGTYSLDFTRVEGEWKDAVRRPQEPAGFPYIVENVTFPNGDITLAGTLTRPEGSGPFPVVVLVTGSGPQDRDETLMGHKPFLVLSDYLTRRGIAVLRYDDRGTHGSGGNYATSDVYDFATDAAAAIEYLCSRGMERVGIAGHSEGGMIAMILAAEGKPDFIVTMAGPGVDGRTLMDSQRAALFGAMGAPQEFIDQYNRTLNAAQEIILETGDRAKIVARITELFAGTPLAGSEEVAIAQLESPEMRSFIKFVPAEYYPRIVCPVLAVSGGKDLQVPAAQNLEAIRLGLAHNPDVTVKAYPALNHLFQTAETGLMAEYGTIEETFNEEVMRDIADWITGGRIND